MNATAENQLKTFPTFTNDEEAERFVDQADLSEYDFSKYKPIKVDRVETVQSPPPSPLESLASLSLSSQRES